MENRFSKQVVVIFLSMLISFSSCNRVVIGIETPQILPPTPDRSKVPSLTSTPEIGKEVSTTTPQSQENLSFTHPLYNFSFNYPSNWTLQQTSNSIKLTFEDFGLLISFKNKNEEKTISINLPEEGTLQEKGSVNFLTQSITQTYIIQSGQVTSVYYNQGKEITAGTMVFTLLLTRTNQNQGSGLSDQIISEVNQIIESFSAGFGLEPTTCSDNANFDADVTIPDDTRFSPGERFIKTWKLTNSGTCTWTKGYSLSFQSGDQMSAPASLPLTSSVAPGETIDVSVELTAPASNGIYRGNWMLSNEKGEQFGIGVNAEKPFWVQITVGEVAPDIQESLGSPTLRDNLESTDYWFMLDTDTTKFSSGENKLVLTALKTGKIDEWGMARYAKLKNFYLEFLFMTGNVCSSLDRYGMIVRAPDPSQGYVFGFSCDGRFRLYIWDGVNYTPIQEWKSSPLINPGPNQENRMGLYANGSVIKLYANGQLLAEYSDQTYTEGQFGVFVAAQDTPGFSVSLEEASYWKFGD